MIIDSLRSRPAEFKRSSIVMCLVHVHAFICIYIYLELHIYIYDLFLYAHKHSNIFLNTDSHLMVLFWNMCQAKSTWRQLQGIPSGIKRGPEGLRMIDLIHGLI